ncbi:ATP-binding cassette domain-containing protein [Streptococcus rifensis]
MTKYLLQFKARNLLHIILLAVNAACLVGASVTLALMTNQLAAGHFKGFLFWISIEMLLYLLYLVFTYLISVHQVKLIQEMSLAVRETYVAHLSQAPFSAFQAKEVGDHLSILNNDIRMIEESGFASFYSLLSTVFTTVFSIIALISFDYRIVLLTLVLTLVLTYLPRPFASKMESYAGQFSIANERFLSGLTDQLSGYKTLYYANRKETLLERIRMVVLAFMAEKVAFTKKSTAIEIIMALFSIVGQVSVLLLTGFLISLGHISLGTISSVGQISGNIFNALTTFNQLQVAISSVKPLFQKLEEANPVVGTDFEGKIDSITARGLRYAFGDHTVFEDLDLTFNKGGKYAIIGESGSGKSTLINAILGNRKHYQGSLKVNQQELHVLNESQLIGHIAYISNQTHIYQDTLRNNLTLWNTDITTEVILASLGKVNLLSLASRLDDQVSPALLSEGQKQRIGIARALLKGNQVIIMDEAMANLDQFNADAIESALLTQSDLTYITVTHHLKPETAERFDQVIRLGAAS